MTTSQQFDLSFDGKLERLKTVLRVTEDQEVAKALGMTKAALSLRKKRGAFPVEKLLELLGQGTLHMGQLTYVTTGTQTEAEKRALERQRAQEEAELPDALTSVRSTQKRLPRQIAPREEGPLQIVSADRWDAIFDGKRNARVPLVAWALVAVRDARQIKGVILGPASRMVYCEDQPEFLCYVPRDVPMP